MYYLYLRGKLKPKHPSAMLKGAEKRGKMVYYSHGQRWRNQRMAEPLSVLAAQMKAFYWVPIIIGLVSRLTQIENMDLTPSAQRLQVLVGLLRGHGLRTKWLAQSFYIKKSLQEVRIILVLHRSFVLR